jgi:hypothetical protein
VGCADGSATGAAIVGAGAGVLTGVGAVVGSARRLLVGRGLGDAVGVGVGEAAGRGGARRGVGVGVGSIVSGRVTGRVLGDALGTGLGTGVGVGLGEVVGDNRFGGAIEKFSSPGIVCGALVFDNVVCAIAGTAAISASDAVIVRYLVKAGVIGFLAAGGVALPDAKGEAPLFAGRTALANCLLAVASPPDARHAHFVAPVSHN